MFGELDKYKSNGHFFFSADDELSIVCNAPKNGVGIYIIYALKGGKIELIYIGSSGKILQSGHKKVRNGEMYDRLVNGKQFGETRKRSWKTKLISEKIEALDIYWYVTFDKENTDIPNTVEGIIIQRFYELYGVLPKWNTKY